MLILKPNCEWCDTDLPPNSNDAMICSYECTFCVNCVESILENVCPNCGGGLSARPIRPTNEYRKGVSLNQHSASTHRVQAKWTLAEISSFKKEISKIPPSDR